MLVVRYPDDVTLTLAETCCCVTERVDESAFVGLLVYSTENVCGDSCYRTSDALD